MVVLLTAHYMIPCKWPVIRCSDVLSPRSPTSWFLVLPKLCFWDLQLLDLLPLITFLESFSDWGGCEVVAPLDAPPSTPL
jgi:hypothetical protein